jgi:hypothetical protein
MVSKKRNPLEETRVFKTEPHRDDKGQYIPYCTSWHHRGIALNEEVCVKRKCTYLKRLYLTLEERTEGITFLKHNEIISDVARRLKREGMEVHENVNYRLSDELPEFEHGSLTSNDRNGEIDIYGVDRENRILIAIEVKENRCNGNDRRAHKQIKKDKLYLSRLFPEFKVKTMYAYGDEKHRRGYSIEVYDPKKKITS